ncbi:MAG: PorP/SprF family type IX secretion system membrane protein [Bacteroidales bacterium]|nr:PorP/SprF family type IX secretion system membrane protein [Bacteroidales bacterium]
MRVFFTISLTILFLTVNAQDQIRLSQFMFNGIVNNPGCTGSHEVFTFNISHRSQWLGFDGAPKSQNISLDWPFKKENFALGILAVNDEIGSRSNKSVFLNYAYRIPLSNGKLSLD